MKKVLAIGVFTVLGVAALSSCRKNYNCVLSDGTVVSTCTKCKKSGVVKAAFDSDCSLSGGTVQEQ